MGKLLMALSLYIGLGSFFAMNAIALLHGASVMTAMIRGVSALALFAALGVIASLTVREKSHPQPQQQPLPVVETLQEE